jgi:hypothetical protein
LLLRSIFSVGSDRRDESIPAARHGFNEAGIVGRISQGFAQLIHRCAQAVIEINGGLVAAPKTFLHFVSGNNLAGSLEEQRKNFEGLILNLDPHSGLIKFFGLQIDFKYAKSNSGRSGMYRCHVVILPKRTRLLAIQLFI